MRRSTTTQDIPISSECSGYRPHYKSLTAYRDYKSTYLNTDPVGNYISTTLGSDLAGNTPDQTVAQMQQNVQSKLSDLQTLETRVYGMTRCIQADIIQRSERAGDLYTLQNKLTAEEKEANDMELIAKNAKERAKRLDQPYSQTTRHETWFPLGRPIKAESVPVLLSISILFLTLALGMFLRLASIDFKIIFPDVSSLFMASSSSSGIPLQTIIIAVLGLVVLFLGLKVTNKI